MPTAVKGTTTTVTAGNGTIVTGTTGGAVSTGGTMVITPQYGPARLIETIVKEDCIELVYRSDPQFSFTIAGSGTQPIPKVWKEVYGVVEGKFGKIKSIDGEHVPAVNTPETYEFNG